MPTNNYLYLYPLLAITGCVDCVVLLCNIIYGYHHIFKEKLVKKMSE